MALPAKAPVARSSGPGLDALDRAPVVAARTEEQRAELADELEDLAALPEHGRQIVEYFEGMDADERAVFDELLELDRRKPLA